MRLREYDNRGETAPKHKKVIAAMPAYNEETSIGSIVLKTKKHVDKVIVIDDGSSDDTAEIVRLAGAEVIKHEKNGGYGAAIKSCFEAAKKEDATAMVIIDADGQHNPEEIPLVLAPVLAGEADMVIGSRFLEAATIPAYRRVGINVLTQLTNIGSKGNVSDSQSGFRAYSKKAIDQLKFNITGMGVGSEILMDAQGLGLRIKEVPITCKYEGVEGSTHNPFRHGISVFNSIFALIKDKHPLIFFGMPGLIFLLIGLYLGVQTIDVYNTLQIFAIGKAMLSVLFMTVGIFSTFTALILDSIANSIKKIRMI